MNSPRVRVIEQEPIVWLGESRQQYDVVIVNVPDPVSYVEAKNYTRCFYRRLGERLGPSGVAAIQATSPFRSPRTFASVDRTLRAVGLFTLAYRAPIPMLGDWGFLLAANNPLSVPQRVPEGLTFLDSPGLARLFQLPTDVRSRDPGVVSTLYRLPLVDVFENERWKQ
jgi:spermidine synthase